MYIRTDDKDNVVELIFIGGKPEHNGYEINDIPKDILNNILEYKYIDGQFIKNETIDKYQENIETIRSIKINLMSNICQSLIEQGIDINNSHYSLTSNDQVELIKLQSLAKESSLLPVYYHADGEKYRLYSNEEFLNIVNTAFNWITFHRTYFNLLKSEIEEMSNAKEIMDINYGVPLNDHNMDVLSSIMNGVVFRFPIITDNFDYETLFQKPDVQSLLNTNLVKEVLNNENQLNDINDISKYDIISENSTIGGLI